MAIEEKLVSTNNNSVAETGNLQPEKFNVNSHSVIEVSEGDWDVTLGTVKALANAGWPIQWATEGLVKGHSCPDEKTELIDIPVNIKSDQVGEIACSESELVAWEIREIADFDHQLGSGKQVESVEGLIKVGSQVDNIASFTSRRELQGIRVVKKTAPKIYNFGLLKLEKTA